MRFGGRTGFVAAALFVVVATVYYFPAHRWVMDSHYSMLTSEAIYRHQSFRLDRHFTNTDEVQVGAVVPGKLPYLVRQYGGHAYYWFPPGTPLLSIPLVMAMNALGVSAVRPDGGYDPAGEERIERVGASLVTAGTVMLLFLLALRFVDMRRALVLALVAAFATGLWSTASRALWSHTWALLLLCGAVLLVVRAEQGDRMRPVLLGTLLAWVYFTRPALNVFIVAIALFVLWRHRRAFIPLALTGAAWLAPFVLYAWQTAGLLLPNYYVNVSAKMTYDTILASLSGMLASPARGVLIYSPVVGLAFWLVLRRRAWSHERPLALLGFGAVGLYVAMMSFFPLWWAGHCYGARYAVDVIPWLALLAAIGWRAAITAKTRSRLARLVTVLAIVVGVALQAVGVFRQGPWLWNAQPNEIDKHTERLWDWRDPPFLR